MNPSPGDSPEYLVFPPFSPSVPRPAADIPLPATPPEEVVQPPAPRADAELLAGWEEPAESDGDVMPWELEMSIDSGEPAAATEEELDDLPWLELPPVGESEQEEPVSTLPEAPPEPDGLPDWMAWDARAEEDAAAELAGTEPVLGLEEYLGAPEAPLAETGAVVETREGTVADRGDVPSDPSDLEFASEATPGREPELSAEVQPEYSPFPAEVSTEAVATEHPEPAVPDGGVERTGPSAGVAEVLGQVAQRLEDIAHALRDRPGDLLSGNGSDDPLELLVTGYVLGYVQGRAKRAG